MNYRTLMFALSVEAIAVAAAAQSVSVQTSTVSTPTTSAPAIRVVSVNSPAATTVAQSPSTSRVRVLTTGASLPVQMSGSQVVESPLVRAANSAKSPKKKATMVIDSKTLLRSPTTGGPEPAATSAQSTEGMSEEDLANAERKRQGEERRVAAADRRAAAAAERQAEIDDMVDEPIVTPELQPNQAD